MKKCIAVLILAFMISYGCQEDPKSDQSNLSPEEVLQRYQAHFDKNEFEAAMELSTPRGKSWIKDIAPMIEGEFGEETITKTIFKSVECAIIQDTASCFCVLKDESETYEAIYKLIRIDGRWLVDAPDEESNIEYEDREEIFEDGF